MDRPPDCTLPWWADTRARPRHARLAELRQQLEALGLKVNAAPVGSPERDRLAERFGEALAGVLALAEELQ